MLRCLACILDSIPQGKAPDSKTVTDALRNGPPAGGALTVYQGGAVCSKHLAAFLAQDHNERGRQALIRRQQLLQDAGVQALMRGAVSQAKAVREPPSLRVDPPADTPEPSTTVAPPAPSDEAPAAPSAEPEAAPQTIEEARAARLKALNEDGNGPAVEM